MICLYVDDMFIISTDLEIVNLLRNFYWSSLARRTADMILGIKILYTKDEIRLSQSYYIENILKKYGYFNLPELSVA